MNNSKIPTKIPRDIPETTVPGTNNGDPSINLDTIESKIPAKPSLKIMINLYLVYAFNFSGYKNM